MKHLKRDEMVVMATCHNHKQPFGITAIHQGKEYIFDWAFKLSATSAKNEGFDKNKVRGAVAFTDHYPGCPHCGAKSFYQCGKCGKIVCWGGQDYVTCPVCGHSGTLTEGKEFDLSGGAL